MVYKQKITSALSPLWCAIAFLLLQLAISSAQRKLNKARHEAPPALSNRASHLASAYGQNELDSDYSFNANLLDKAAEKRKQAKTAAVKTVNRNLERDRYDREGRMYRRGDDRWTNDYDGEQHQSATMPALLILLLVAAVSVGVVWIESRYGWLESLFRIVSPDSERSSVEERLTHYGGGRSLERRVKKKKSKRRHKLKRKRKARDNSDSDDSEDDEDERRRKRKRKKHRRSKSASSKSSASKSSKSPKKKKTRRGVEDSEDSSTE